MPAAYGSLAAAIAYAAAPPDICDTRAISIRISNLVALRALKSYPLEVAFLSKELSNALPGRDVAIQGGILVVFSSLLEVVRDAVVIDAAHIISCKCRARPAQFIVAMSLAGYEAVHALVGGIR